MEKKVLRAGKNYQAKLNASKQPAKASRQNHNSWITLTASKQLAKKQPSTATNASTQPVKGTAPAKSLTANKGVARQTKLNANHVCDDPNCVYCQLGKAILEGAHEVQEVCGYLFNMPGGLDEVPRLYMAYYDDKERCIITTPVDSCVNGCYCCNIDEFKSKVFKNPEVEGLVVTPEECLDITPVEECVTFTPEITEGVI